MLVQTTYSEWSKGFAYGSSMNEDFTEATLEAIDLFFDEIGEAIDDSHELNPDNFYVNILSIFDAEDLEEYGFTVEQIKTAHDNTCAYSASEPKGDLVDCHVALESVNPDAYRALIDEKTVFGWTDNGQLVTM